MARRHREMTGESLSQRLANVLHQQDEVQGVGGRLLEPVALVEASGGDILGMHEDGSGTDERGGFGRAAEGLHQHVFAKMPALLSQIDGEAGQHDDGDRLSPLTPGEPVSGVSRLHTAGGQGVAGDHSLVPARHVGHRLARPCVGESAVGKVVVESGHPAVEGGDLVVLLERLRSEEWLSAH